MRELGKMLFWGGCTAACTPLAVVYSPISLTTWLLARELFDEDDDEIDYEEKYGDMGGFVVLWEFAVKVAVGGIMLWGVAPLLASATNTKESFDRLRR